jgi:glyoxylate carboligase
LYQLYQHALSRYWELVVGFGVQKANIKTGRTWAYTARRKAHALGCEPFNGLGQVVNPQANVVKGGGVYRWLFVGVNGLHEINLHLEGAHAHGANIFVNVFTLTLKVARDLKAQHVHPQGAQLGLI